MNALDVSWDEFVAELFADEYCVAGNWFAHCKQPLAPGVIVETQHGAPEHRGRVLAEVHPLDGWVWVQWEHIGRHDEYIVDLTVIGRLE